MFNNRPNEILSKFTLFLFYTCGFSFLVSDFVGKWTRFAFKVTTENVTLYFNCREYDTVTVKRHPQELVFDSASTLYIAQAGPLIRAPFDVSRRRSGGFTESIDGTA